MVERLEVKAKAYRCLVSWCCRQASIAVCEGLRIRWQAAGNQPVSSMGLYRSACVTLQAARTLKLCISHRESHCSRSRGLITTAVWKLPCVPHCRLSEQLVCLAHVSLGSVRLELDFVLVIKAYVCASIWKCCVAFRLTVFISPVMPFLPLSVFISCHSHVYLKE